MSNQANTVTNLIFCYFQIKDNIYADIQFIKQKRRLEK